MTDACCIHNMYPEEGASTGFALSTGVFPRFPRRVPIRFAFMMLMGVVPRLARMELRLMTDWAVPVVGVSQGDWILMDSAG